MIMIILQTGFLFKINQNLVCFTDFTILNAFCECDINLASCVNNNIYSHFVSHSEITFVCSKDD